MFFLLFVTLLSGFGTFSKQHQKFERTRCCWGHPRAALDLQQQHRKTKGCPRTEKTKSSLYGQ